MLHLLFLVPIIPFASFIWLAIVGPRTSRTAIATVGVGSIAACTVISLLITAFYLASPPPGGSFTQVLWTWIAVDGFTSQIAFYLDALSLIMMLVVSFVSFIIHLYSAEFMLEGEGYTEVGGQRFDWRENDIVIIPNFLWRRHVNTGKKDAVLYTVSDAALMKNIGQYRAQGKTAAGEIAQLVS